jgi:hypothetical protein
MSVLKIWVYQDKIYLDYSYNKTNEMHYFSDLFLE